MPTGVYGAAHFDDGYIQVGSGRRTVDIYLDLMCPFCKQFEQLSGPFIFQEVAAKGATLRIHPVSFLDRLSSGTLYSTRAASAVVDVAAHHPEHVIAFIQALYANQPAEGSSGLDDSALAKLAAAADAPLTPSAQSSSYTAWVAHWTQRVSQGPLPETKDIARVEAVPTVLVDGAHFANNSNETDAFRDFYNGH